MEYAVIETGGKQYTVHPGDTLKVERLSLSSEGPVELDRVLLVARDGEIKVGQPLVEGARVMVQVIGQGKAPKVTAFKFKNKVRYRRRRGHRQPYTQIRVTEIVSGEKAPTGSRTDGASKVTEDGP